MKKVYCPYCPASAERPEGVEMTLHSDAMIYYVCKECGSRSPGMKRPPVPDALGMDIQAIHKAEGLVKLAAMHRCTPVLKPLPWEDAVKDDYFLEIRGEDYIDTALLTNAFYTQGKIEPCDNVHYKTHECDDLKLLGVDYGKTWRVWPRRPTEMECRLAKWEGEKAPTEEQGKTEIAADAPQECTGMETEDNRIIISGWFVDGLTLDHVSTEESIYSGTLRVPRLSGVEDLLPVIVPARAIGEAIPENEQWLEVHGMVKIEGQVRTRWEGTEAGLRHVVRVFAKSLEFVEDGEAKNEVSILGRVCKCPIYRKTPLGRELCEIMLVVKRSYGKVDYIPCIAWGNAARFSANLQSGEEISLRGRMQSREFQKQTGSGESIMRRVCEISIFTIRRATQ